MTATVVVTTRNRKDDLRRCLHSVVSQSVPVEVIVIDDASDDGSAAMVRAEFPAARLIEHRTALGYIRGRNEAAQAATGDIIISLDDDALFSSSGIVAETLTYFDDDRIAAVAIPYIDVNRDAVVRQSSPDRQSIYVTETFIGTAHALRRSIFLALGGYREPLFHQGEESDLSVRLLQAGYVVRLGGGEPIHHFESPRRDFRRMDFYGPRNAILFVWQNVPLPDLLWQMPMTLVGLLIHALRPSRLVTRIGGVVDGFATCARSERRPVSRGCYRLWRRLRRAAAPLRLDTIETALQARA
jgi:GT2 family glycosyltransferase